MNDAEPWTILRLLDWTTAYLRDRGSPSARLDAEILLAEARGCERIRLYTAFDEVADDRTRTAFRELVRRRAEGTPVAYLVGHREFYSVRFCVTPDVLIPRPETELVVVKLLDRVRQLDSSGAELAIADVGTGSGILAICAALHVPNCRVTAIDISAPALAVARQNAELHDVLGHIDFMESDLFAALPADARFDFILSNPPYVSTTEYENLAIDVRQHEPHTALLAGPTGTEIIERLIPPSAERLWPGGWLILEISPMIEDAVVDIVDGHPDFGDADVTKDLAQLPRVVACQRK